MLQEVGPLLFLIYIKDLINEWKNLSNRSLLADNAKLSQLLKSNSDNMKLQKAVNKLNLVRHMAIRS